MALTRPNNMRKYGPPYRRLRAWPRNAPGLERGRYALSLGGSMDQIQQPSSDNVHPDWRSRKRISNEQILDVEFVATCANGEVGNRVTPLAWRVIKKSI